MQSNTNILDSVGLKKTMIINTGQTIQNMFIKLTARTNYFLIVVL